MFNCLPFKKNYVFTIILILLYSALTPLYPQTAAGKDDSEQNLFSFIEDSRNEIDFYSLEELLNVEVDVASMFKEDELVVGSSVSSITPSQ